MTSYQKTLYNGGGRGMTGVAIGILVFAVIWGFLSLWADNSYLRNVIEKQNYDLKMAYEEIEGLGKIVNTFSKEISILKQESVAMGRG